MPYEVKGKCVFKKDGGAKVGCTKGSIDKYLAALHANASESVTETNKLKGGKADKLTIQDIANKFNVSIDKIKSQINKGIDVEFEHTSDKEKATEIATDHVSEFPDYYDRLEKMEDKAKTDLVTETTKNLIKRLLKESLGPIDNITTFAAVVSSRIREAILKQGFTRTQQRRTEDRFINEYRNGLGDIITTQAVWTGDKLNLFFNLRTNRITQMTQQDINRFNETYEGLIKNIMTPFLTNQKYPVEYHIDKL